MTFAFPFCLCAHLQLAGLLIFFICLFVVTLDVYTEQSHTDVRNETVPRFGSLHGNFRIDLFKFGMLACTWNQIPALIRMRETKRN